MEYTLSKMDGDKLKIGHKKVKGMEAGVYTNLQLLRQALNELCTNENIEVPESLAKLNEVFS